MKKVYPLLRFYAIGLLLCLPFQGLLAQQSQTHLVDSIKAECQRVPSDVARLKILEAVINNLECEDTAAKLTFIRDYLGIVRKLEQNKDILGAYLMIGNVYFRCAHNYQNAVYWYDSCAVAAQNSGNNKKEADAFGSLAAVYEEGYKNHARAIEYYLKSMATNPDPDNVKTVLGNMGTIYTALANYPKAADCFERAYNIQNKQLTTKENCNTNDSLTLMGLLITLGDLSIKTGQYNKALENYRKILSINERIRYVLLDMMAYMGIAECFHLKKDYDRAIENNSKALAIARAEKDAENAAYILVGLGNIYLEKGSVAEAREFAGKALKITGHAAGRARSYLPATYLLLGKIYASRKDFAASVGYMEQAIKLYHTAQQVDDESLAWSALSNTYQQMHKTADAFDAYRRYISLRDSIYSQAKTREITSITMQSEFDRQRENDSLKQAGIQAQRDAVANLRIQKQRIWIYGGFAGLAAVIVLSFFIYRNYANQKKANILVTIEKENAEMQRQRAERSEEFKQQFLANMSHEIRTPMNAVSGMTDLLLEKGPRADQLNYLQVIAKSSDILLHIINDILDLSKIEAGKLEMEKIDFSLSDTVQLVKETLSVKSEEKGLHLLANIDERIPDVLLGDPYRINQILINLGGNAIKFTERGTVELGVQLLAAEDREARLRFSVTDTGAGIPEDKLGNLFESFKQVNASDTRKYGGTGLGLSISRQLVALQGGQISVESVVGSGTTFSFVLSFERGSPQRLAERIRGEQKADGSMLNGLRILLVDDNEYNRLVANEALTLKAKVVIHEAHNGEEAVRMIQEQHFDVVLMDVLMPVMDGLEATRYIRKNLPAPLNAIPVIALTASMLRNDLDKCVQAGMNTYVPKPFKTWQLIAAIAQVTGRTGYVPPEESVIEPVALVKDNTATITAPVRTGCVTDLVGLHKFCEGDVARMKKYVAIYLRAIMPFEENAALHAAENDLAEIGTLVHTFKPKWMMMGMKECTEIARNVEAMCESGGEKGKIFSGLQELVAMTRISGQELEEFI